jgi:TIR domain
VISQPDAFLSYTRIDDDYFGGSITSLRKFLELGVQVVTGQRDFKIFQDIDGIEFGEQWQKRLDQSIVGARFLIPIVTPLFFQSKACRTELEKFVAHEKEQRRDDLILPIYFVTAPVLEKQELLDKDPLAKVILSRQRYDWRSKADLPLNDPQVKGSVRELSEKIAAAIARIPENLQEAPTTDEAFPGSASMQVDERVKVTAFDRASNTVMNAEPEEQTRDRKTILWVDDRPNNNVYERRAMERYNIDFELAKSTGEALDKLRKSSFDAIISDMGRPPDPRAGYTLLDALRNGGNLPPFFIYAGSDSAQHRALALSKGALESTNSPDKLISAVLNSLGERP